MKRLTLSLSLSTASILLFHSCEEVPETVEITEQRELCKFDESELYRYNMNRFKGKQPLDWRRVPRTKFRKLNYRAGKNTEIAVGASSGGILANVSRWYGEFSQKLPEGFTDSTIKSTEKILGGHHYYLVEIQGGFETTMERMNGVKPDYACLGILCPVDDHLLVSIKMVGPISEVNAQKENFLTFARNLTYRNTRTNSSSDE